MVKAFVHYHKKYLIKLSALAQTWKFGHEDVCNVHHINKPQVAYIRLN